MWRRTKCTSAPLLRAEARRAEDSLGSLINDRRVESLPTLYRYSEGRCARCGSSSTSRITSKPLLAGDIHMGILTDDMKRIVREQRLGYIATVCPDGTPNLSPKGTTAVWDDDHL